MAHVDITVPIKYNDIVYHQVSFPKNGKMITHEVPAFVKVIKRSYILAWCPYLKEGIKIKCKKLTAIVPSRDDLRPAAQITGFPVSRIIQSPKDIVIPNKKIITNL